MVGEDYQIIKRKMESVNMSKNKKQEQGLSKEELKEIEREYIRRYFKETLKLDIDDIVKSGLMSKEQYEEFLDRQFSMRFKICLNCGLIKAKRNFYNYTRSKDGVYYCCKACQDLQSRPFHAKFRARERKKNEGYYIYLIFNKENKNLEYVGATINIQTRMVSHFYCQVDSTRDLFENNLGLVAYIRLETKEEMNSLEVALINNKKKDDKLPCISTQVIFDKYVIDYPRRNKNKGAGQADAELLAEICCKINSGEYKWKIWNE